MFQKGFTRLLLLYMTGHTSLIPKAISLFLFILIAGCVLAVPNDTVIVRSGITGQRINDDWKRALVNRMSKALIDSFSRLHRDLNANEKAWMNLVTARSKNWHRFTDSLALPFLAIQPFDTNYVLLGFLGSDDGFTYGEQTVCLDLTALSTAYGEAGLPENGNRLDRIFAHEYTHLLHKQWAKKNGYAPATFMDSITWECLYEGIGMYRSLNAKWLPVTGKLPGITAKALEKLYPIFVSRLIRIETAPVLTAMEKEMLHKNLSRGNVDQKWGAFTVAIWLALESGGDDIKLQYWINKGPASVIELAKKYMPGDLAEKLSGVFKD